MKSSFLIILGLIYLAHCATLNEVSCQVATSTATYNLNPLKLPLGKYYTVNDLRTSSGTARNVTLFFNFCADLEPPQETTLNSVCNSTGQTDHYREGPASSFLENQSENQCYHAASRIDKVKPSNSVLFDPADATNPATGVILKLIGGEESGAKYFETHITVNCIGQRQSVDVPKQNIILVKDGYIVEMTIESPFGCPNECVSGGTLCGQHGICSYDGNSKNSHCYCNDGYTGIYCDKKNVFSWFNMTILFVVLVVLLAVLILGFAIRIDARMNIDALNSLEKQFNQLGQLA